MALLTVQNISLTGLTPTFTAADSLGDEFPNDGNAFLVVKNDGASDITVTIDSQKPCSYGYDHDITVTVPAGGEKWIGPFPQSRFNDTSGRVQVSYSDVTSVTVAVVEVE